MVGIDSAQSVQMPKLIENNRINLDGAQVVALFEVDAGVPDDS